MYRVKKGYVQHGGQLYAKGEDFVADKRDMAELVSAGIVMELTGRPQACENPAAVDRQPEKAVKPEGKAKKK